MTYSGSGDEAPILVRRWPRSARCVGVARQELRQELEAWGLSRLAETAELVLSELFGNAVRHACPPRGRLIETRYERALGGVRIEVHDANENWPELRKANADEECGRGLLLVDALTGSRWGVSERDGWGSGYGLSSPTRIPPPRQRPSCSGMSVLAEAEDDARGRSCRAELHD
jgi:anti-sigma regulatory factor (Ser/Thr protein kinase)